MDCAHVLYHDYKLEVLPTAAEVSCILINDDLSTVTDAHVFLY